MGTAITDTPGKVDDAKILLARERYNARGSVEAMA
jgi:hypothetical protein